MILKNSPTGPKKSFGFHLDPDIHWRFKLRCTELQMSMSEAMSAAIARWLQETESTTVTTTTNSTKSE